MTVVFPSGAMFQRCGGVCGHVHLGVCDCLRQRSLSPLHAETVTGHHTPQVGSQALPLMRYSVYL